METTGNNRIDREKLNVLMVASELSWRGGEAQVDLLMRGLAKKGMNVTLAAPSAAAITGKAAANGVTCLPLEISGGMDVAAAWKLRSYLQRSPFDIVHCHTSHAHSIAFMALQATGLPRSPENMKDPLLVVSRRVDFPVATNGFSALKYRHGADVFLAISKGVRDVLLGGGVDANRIHLVRSGIDFGKFDGIDTKDVREEFGITDETVVIGNVAALAPHKSHVDFVGAAALIAREMPQAKFLIVGEGEMRAEIEGLVQKLRLQDSVILTGFRQDVLALLSLFDCFVLSSYLEGLGTSIMDAQYLGIPVVATRTGGVPELVEHGVTGLLVPPRDPAAIAAAVVEMMRDKHLREQCVESAKVKARDYDHRRMVDETMDAYNATLRQHVKVL